MVILLTILAYLSALMLFSRLTSRRSDNETFYRGNRRSPWYMVAFGMIGASISGITFVSVPGMVLTTQMTYLQTCLGFILGYFAVAFVLLPVYYRLNLTTIYTYLDRRLGKEAYKTGAWFFLLSKMTGAAVRFYVVCIILHRFVLSQPGVPFIVTVTVMVGMIWLYTRRGGIKTLVWTDTFQTLCMFTALLIIIYNVTDALGYNIGDAVRAVAADEHSKMFVFDDWVSRQNFWKQFFSGVFIVIVMTGLDQDMMQKNLTCKTLREAQKDMCTYGMAFVPANLLFMALGVLLTMLAQQQGMPLPDTGDELLPMFAASGYLGNSVVVLFTIGIVAASFSSADSALTAMTTSYCVDIRERHEDEPLRRKTHLAMAVVFAVIILAVDAVGSSSVIDAIYILCSYTYGPLLGLFAFGLITRRGVSGRAVPYIAIASPLLCFAIDKTVAAATGYRFGYELLMLNGALTFAGLYLSGSKTGSKQDKAKC
ncbi:MAG: sodium:solute symporter [Prevotella sp.]|uniref:sodium:solute symporter n=1 Tax=Prevotella sp. TaxID=59823 RepID=UPI002A29E1C7|nr:sodium:solute symporter [Prevotella sp.]MDD7317445.1 sodium:solute symporter [Prevotellaceae bacterium]MDY4019219.1 sodium:solute symporter [Prevotella sp.]